MPRPPLATEAVRGMAGAVYSSLAGKLAAYKGEKYPLHVGDTWVEPILGARMEDLSVAENPGMHRYNAVQGIPDLVAAIAERVASRTGRAVAHDEVLVTAGATGGLAAWAAAFVEPGEEVLVLSPSWPLFAGSVRIVHGTPVHVPFADLPADDAAGLLSRLSAAVTARTVAVYFSSPNNPSGRVFSEAWLRAIAEFAREHDLWVVADEVYEDFVFAGHHVPMRPIAPERTITAYSLSKSFGMAGNRCGYLVGPAAALAEVRKVGTHFYYHAPTSAQIAAVKVLSGAGESWVANLRSAYALIAQHAAARLGVAVPEGGTFLFVDVAESLDERGLEGFLERCVSRGLLVAPGLQFGPYPHHVRVCFTCEQPELVLRGMDVLAAIMGR